MNYKIEQGPHSADKDHTQMTGGTLSVDKTITEPEGVTFYTYTIPFFQKSIWDIDFHKGIHTAEHLLAYKKDTGSVRNSLEEITQWQIDGKVILDISPYKTGVDTFGFRITSMIPLEISQVQSFIKISIERAIQFLKSWKSENPRDFQGIPFAREESCGQYDFHDKQGAIDDLGSIDTTHLGIQKNILVTKHTTAYVCDLRFLKPKQYWKHDMTMFTPKLSYQISEIIEKYLPEKISESIVIVGTFGCMTGMYLCVSSSVWNQTDIANIHQNIIEILQEHIDISQLSDREKIEFETLLQNYQEHAKK